MSEITPAEAALDALAAKMHAMPRHRIDVTVAGGEADVVDEVLGVLSCVPGLELYARSGRLVHVTEDAGGPKIDGVESARVRDLISRYVVFTKWTEKGGEREIATPSWVGDMILARPSWPMLRSLRGISTYPFMRHDGTICAEDGFDPHSGILVVECGEIQVPDAPTQEDAQQAAEELLGPFSEFPFAGPEHRAVVAALILSILARPAYDGPTPLFLADAPVPGAGKGLLVSSAALLATGRRPSAAPWSKSEEERRKAITSKLAEGEPIVLFDNLTSTLGGASLDALLTSTRWSDRILGRSESITLENRAVWTATSNNCDVGGDTARRALICRLNPDTDRPELRTFEREALADYVRRERPRLLAAALTMLRAFWREYGDRIREDLGGVMREQRESGLEPFGSFEGWSVVIRGACVYAGLPDPAKTREMLRDRASTELEDLRRLVGLLAEFQSDKAAGKVWSTGDLRKALVADKAAHGSGYDDLADLLRGMTRGKGDSLPSSKSLGWLLRKHSDRIVSLEDGPASIRRVDAGSKRTLWEIECGFSVPAVSQYLRGREIGEKSQEARGEETANNEKPQTGGGWEYM